MEEDNDDNTTAGGGGLETKSVPSAANEKVYEMDEGAAKAQCDPVNEPGEAQHSEKSDESTGKESEIKSVQFATDEKVVTHESDEKCERALKDLKANSSFVEKRYHTCTRSMTDVKEIIALLEKIDIMVCENEYHCYSGLCDEDKEQNEPLDHKSQTEGRINTSVFQQNQIDEEETAANTEIKCDPVSGAKHSDKDDDSTRVGGDSETTPVIPSTNNEKGETDEVKEVNNESSSNMTEPSMKESDAVKDTSPSSQTVSAETKEVVEQEESTTKTEMKCDPVSGAEHSDKDDDSTRVGGDSETTPVISSTNNEKGETDEVKEVNNESSSNMTERSMKESDAVKDTSPSSQTVSAETKEVVEQEESAAKSECDPMKELGDDKHSKNHDHASVGECEIKTVRSANTEKGTLDMDKSGNKNKQSVKSSEEINRKEQYQRETKTLLGRLHLQDKHQQKLSPADFLKVGPPVKQDHETSEKELAHTFLQRLMMLDYRARYIPVRQDRDEVTHSKSVVEFDTVDTDDDDLSDFYSTTADFDQSKQTHVHPMDVQMAVFHCSDSFLKQNMITKLSQCQYALPLLVPDPVTMDIECPLWTFRQIRKTWKVTEIKDNSNIVTMKSMPICKAETPMVSFLRLGSLSLSKSQLINTLINDRHSTFFHRNCPGSTKSRHLMDGVAEIAWYCPAGKPNDTFTDCIAFCNLHGDALSIEKQCDILTEKSSMNVVLVPTLGKGDKSSAVISAFLKSPKPLICLTADRECGAFEKKKGKYIMGLQDRNQSDVSEELKRIIGRILSGPHASFRLETMAEVSGIRVDEDDKVCQKGKSAAMKTVNLLQGMDVSAIKDTFLPCQGQLWHKFCRINKELYHLKGHTEKEKLQKQQELMRIRQDQCIASCSKPMKLFTETLSSLSSTDREYFLKWTQILIDALSTDDRSLILQSYDEKWSEVLALKKKHDKSDQLKSKQTELEQISTKLQSATFGLEHIFREMGQIYEAHASLQKQKTRGQTDWSKYPELVAELMISGHPMELMDGDAVYRKLEERYMNWTWALRSNMLTIENGLYTRIENGKHDKVELSYLHEEMKITYEKIKKAMTTYFDDDRDKEILVQWRGRFESKIKEFHDDQVRGVKRKLDEVIEQKNACKKLNDKKTEFENKLLQKSKELAHQLKDKAKDEEELKKQFNSVWSGWVSELTAGTKPIEDINYKKDQATILQELGFEWSLIDKCESSGSYKKISEVGNYVHYVALSKDRDLCNTGQHKNERKKDTTGQRISSRPANRLFEFVSETATKTGYFFKGYFQYEEQQLIRSFIDSIEKQSLDAIKSKPVASRGYSPNYLHEVANSVKEKVAEFESNRKYTLKKEFTVDLLLYVFDKAGRWLSESHKEFKRNNNALTYVESKKKQYYNIFSSFCRGSSSAVVFGELICEKLKSSTVEAVCNKTAIDLAGEMKCSFPAFSGNRLNLEKHLLKSLAEEEDFGGFITYIRHPRNQAETFIRKEVQKYILTDNKDKAQNILKKNVEDINKLVSQALFAATEKVKTQRGDSDMWVKEFSSLLKDELTFDTICCQNFSDINNFDFLTEEIEKGLVSLMKDVSSLSLDKMEEFRMKPDQILIDQLCNCCWAKCPFCAAVCTNTLENHSPDKHSVPCHRPSGIEGWHFKNTVELDINFCTTLVASDQRFHPHHDSDQSIPYKQYQRAGEEYATWQITPDESKLTYWKWFVCRFQQQLEDHYKLKFQGRGEIPPEWRYHSKQEAIESLDEMYNL
ncbi:hypothetical protein ABVT39_014876 [Epinephelus coioides]